MATETRTSTESFEFRLTLSDGQRRNAQKLLRRLQQRKQSKKGQDEYQRSVSLQMKKREKKIKEGISKIEVGSLEHKQTTLTLRKIELYPLQCRLRHERKWKLGEYRDALPAPPTPPEPKQEKKSEHKPPPPPPELKPSSPSIKSEKSEAPSLSASDMDFTLPMPTTSDLSGLLVPQGVLSVRTIPTEIKLAGVRQRIEEKRCAEIELKALEEQKKKQDVLKERKRWCDCVIRHYDVFTEVHKNKNKMLATLANRCMKRFQTMEQRKKRREEKIRQQRMNALKENDMDAYTELLNKTKNTRLTKILDQTKEFLTSIGVKIQDEQQHNISVASPRSTPHKASKPEDTKSENKHVLSEAETAKSADNKAILESKNEDSMKDQPSTPKGEATPSSKSEADSPPTTPKKKSSSSSSSSSSVLPSTPTNSKNIRPTEYYTMVHGIEEKIKEQPKSLTGGVLREYQIGGIEWLVSLYNNNLNGILADEMGLGKTVQTIALICYLMDMKDNRGPFLVVAPLSTISNWKKEFKKWAPTVRCISYIGRPEERKAMYKDYIKPRFFNVLITTYEFIMNRHDKSRLSHIHWNYIIVDEGHRMKNKASKFTITMSSKYKSSHRVILSGTPLQNNLSELWSLLNFLLPRIFNSEENFEEWFNRPFEDTGFSSEDAELGQEEKMLVINRLHTILRPFLLRRLKKDVEHELADKVEYIVRCRLSAWQRLVYNQIKNKHVMELDASGKVRGKLMNNTIMQLRKICNHPYTFYYDIHYDWEKEYKVTEEIYRCSAKFELLDRMLDKFNKTKHQVLVFCQMTRVMDILGDYFEWKGYKFVRLDGSTKAEKRATLLTDFTAANSEYFIFLLSTRAGGLGLNLQTADTVILFDSDWNPQMDVQAQDRAHRIGQENQVKIFRLQTDTPVEQQIFESAQRKLKLDNLVIQAGKFDKKTTAGDRRAVLKNILGQEACTEVDMDEIPSDDELNRMLSRSDEEYMLFDEMDTERKKLEEEKWIKNGNVLPRPERLMQEHEVPKHIKASVDKIKNKMEEDEIAFGRGRRAKSTVNYNDQITDEEFLAFVEGVEDDAEIPERCVEPSKKRKQKELDDESKESAELQEELLSVLKQIRKLKDKKGKMSRWFVKLPKDKDSEFYRLIDAPIDINTIKKNSKRGKYSSKEEFWKDFRKMTSDAQIVYKKGSIHNNAVFLRDKCRLFLFGDDAADRFSDEEGGDEEDELDYVPPRPKKRGKKRKVTRKKTKKRKKKVRKTIEEDETAGGTELGAKSEAEKGTEIDIKSGMEDEGKVAAKSTMGVEFSRMLSAGDGASEEEMSDVLETKTKKGKQKRKRSSAVPRVTRAAKKRKKK